MLQYWLQGTGDARAGAGATQINSAVKIGTGKSDAQHRVFGKRRSFVIYSPDRSLEGRRAAQPPQANAL